MVSDLNRRCYSCANKGKNNPNFGCYKYKISKIFLIQEYIRDRKSAKDIANQIGCSKASIYRRLKKCDIHVRNSVESHKEIVNKKYSFITKSFLIKEYIVNKKSAYQIAKEINSGKNLIYNRLRKYNIKIRTKSEARKGKYKGKKAPRFGKVAHGKWGEYKGIWMRSSWEIKYAKYLDGLGIEWKYEPRRFDLDNMTYLPDFYLPNKKIYVEIKGWLSIESYKKIKKFKIKFPEKKLIILEKKELEKLGVLKYGTSKNKF